MIFGKYQNKNTVDDLLFFHFSWYFQLVAHFTQDCLPARNGNISPYVQYLGW